MKTKTLKSIMNAMNNVEDDLYATIIKFRKLSAKEMTQKYGESEFTRQEYLDVFQLEVDKLKQCINGLKILHEQYHREYENYEFCKNINCPEVEGKAYCDNDPRYCLFSDKRFHNWLQENNFKIIKGIL